MLYSFSPSIQAQFKSVDLPLAGTYSGYSFDKMNKPITTRMFHWSGTYAQFIELFRACEQDTESSAYRQGGRNWHGSPGAWGGFAKSTPAEMTRTGTSTDAQAAFDAAIAALDVTAAPAPPIPAVTGGVWSVPRYLASHPKCAIKRPRTSLPPKNWHVAACFSSYVKSNDVAKPLARLARAAWMYTLKGGAATITIHYTVRFHRPNGDHQGATFSIKVPLSNVAALASCLSVQIFRHHIITLGQALSGQRDDSLAVSFYIPPGGIRVAGDWTKDAAALRSLGITE